uniref:SDR family NAD(P)-dependent oxidoreductase n=1 Tax=Pararhizobium sp. IMCC3301 TaxID=3067904 RepID=UPI002740F650|nr:SDR family NAD(P)-dependent oxidoreductase [Pararhizobium sp. IMCC3301]
MNRDGAGDFGFTTPFSAIIFGTSGGIGSALMQKAIAALSDRNLSNTPEGRIFAVNRRDMAAQERIVTCLRADALEEPQLVQAAATVRSSMDGNACAPVRLIIVATGALQTANGNGPEKSWRDLSCANMQEIYAANAVAPALIAKHFLPLLPKSGRSVFAALSARVGSISDNRLGGWYSYRASKAALNQILKTASIELSRTHSEAICVGLHPGTVDTGLSKPFQANVPDDKLFTTEQAAAHLLKSLSSLTAKQSGQVIAWDGTPVPA